MIKEINESAQKSHRNNIHESNIKISIVEDDIKKYTMQENNDLHI